MMDWNISREETLRARAVWPREAAAQRDLFSVYKYWKGGCKEDRARLCISDAQ